MKIKRIFLGIAVAAVAGVNVYLANDIRVQRNELSLLNLENIAEALENWIIEYGTPTNKGHHSSDYPCPQGTWEWADYPGDSKCFERTYYGGAQYKVDVYRTDVNCVGEEPSKCTPFVKIFWCNPQRIH